MRLKENAEVITADLETIGKIDRVVIDPVSNDVTHLVAKKGLLFTKERVIPVAYVETTTPDTVILKKSADAPDSYPLFEEKDYIPVGSSEDFREAESRQARKLLWYNINIETPLSKPAPYPRGDKPLFRKKIKQNIPKNTIAMEEGARVVDAFGNKLGQIKDIHVETDSLDLTHVVVSSGVFEKEKKLIPANWINDISESSVTLYIDQDIFEALPSVDDDTGGAK